MPQPGARLRFTKMHGAGNDFVLLDLRDNDPLGAGLSWFDTLTTSATAQTWCRALADRHTGVGCDQILTIEPPRSVGALASYRIWNADGSAAQQCGNGARCVAAWLQRDAQVSQRECGDRFLLDSPAGSHLVERIGEGEYAIAMGRPQFDPASIPLAGFIKAQDVYAVSAGGEEIRFGAVGFGNPHALIEVDDVDSAAVPEIGSALQAHPAFPESVNVGFAQVIADDHMRLRVYERGAGETLACGSGACAAAAVLMRRGRIARDVAVELPGGTLHLDWPSDDASMRMSGPAAFVFEGDWLQ